MAAWTGAGSRKPAFAFALARAKHTLGENDPGFRSLGNRIPRVSWLIVEKVLQTRSVHGPGLDLRVTIQRVGWVASRFCRMCWARLNHPAKPATNSLGGAFFFQRRLVRFNALTMSLSVVLRSPCPLLFPSLTMSLMLIPLRLAPWSLVALCGGGVLPSDFTTAVW